MIAMMGECGAPSASHHIKASTSASIERRKHLDHNNIQYLLEERRTNRHIYLIMSRFSFKEYLWRILFVTLLLATATHARPKEKKVLPPQDNEEDGDNEKENRSSFSHKHNNDNENDDDNYWCPCKLPPQPDLWKKAETARWMVHTLDWGVLTTISTRIPGIMIPFGNVYSFVDGPCENSTGIPYFFGTYMDQSFKDIQKHDYVSLTLSEASLATVCRGALPTACDASTKTGGYYGDVESPVCARLTLSGRMIVIDAESDEYQFAQRALFQRHPDMEGWPTNHEWVIAKLDLMDVWLIDYFGGASIISVDDYLNAQPVEMELEDSH